MISVTTKQSAIIRQKITSQEWAVLLEPHRVSPESSDSSTTNDSNESVSNRVDKTLSLDLSLIKSSKSSDSFTANVPEEIISYRGQTPTPLTSDMFIPNTSAKSASSIGTGAAMEASSQKSSSWLLNRIPSFRQSTSSPKITPLG